MSGERCKSCGAAIEWAVTRKGHRMPIDAGTFADGNVLLTEQPGRPYPLATVGSPGSGDRRSHFTSCPDAARHRKRGRDAR